MAKYWARPQQQHMVELLSNTPMSWAASKRVKKVLASHAAARATGSGCSFVLRKYDHKPAGVHLFSKNLPEVVAGNS